MVPIQDCVSQFHGIGSTRLDCLIACVLSSSVTVIQKTLEVIGVLSKLLDIPLITCGHSSNVGNILAVCFLGFEFNSQPEPK